MRPVICLSQQPINQAATFRFKRSLHCVIYPGSKFANDVDIVLVGRQASVWNWQAWVWSVYIDMSKRTMWVGGGGWGVEGEGEPHWSSGLTGEVQDARKSELGVWESGLQPAGEGEPAVDSRFCKGAKLKQILAAYIGPLSWPGVCF